MDTQLSLSPQIEDAFEQQGQPALSLEGAKGRYVLLSEETFAELTGTDSQREADLASVRRGIADTAAGRTKPASEVFDRLQEKYAS